MHRFAAAAIFLSIAGYAGAASAADLPARSYTKAPVIAEPAYNWSGFYAGVVGGGAWGRSQNYQDDPAASAAAVAAGRPAPFGLAQTSGISPSGALVGGTVGYNYQFSNNVVIGIENDLSWTDLKGTANYVPPFRTTDTAQTSQSWLDTLRGRLGFAWNRWLVYGTGGVAVTEEKFLICNVAVGCAGQSKTVAGWAAGGGVEYAFAGNLSAKLEYLHADFGTQSFTRTPIANGFYAARNITLTNDIVRVGVNYKFGWDGPLIAKY
ncbi:outer membrane protein [Bradyrhizobium sp. 2TAF24]|uniref:outer membrane protein n=1 Tax=Bradyrhizobium sp. 2TAF24 TaxID=3233011 RepID=UPI003F8F5493